MDYKMAHNVEAAGDLEDLCKRREGWRIVYEDLCPQSHWPDIFSLWNAVSAPQTQPRTASLAFHCLIVRVVGEGICCPLRLLASVCIDTHGCVQDVPKHPLYRTKRCKHGSATQCPMHTMCVPPP